MEPQIKRSVNHKALESMNFGLATCRPTRWCLAHCYARGRSREDGVELGSTANSGPVTWPTQQAMYDANIVAAKVLYNKGNRALERAAKKLADRQRRVGRCNIRWNGVGDLFFEIIPLIAHIAAFGIKVWGFSRRPEKIHLLAETCKEWGVAEMPYFLGSVDPTTSHEETQLLVDATQDLSGSPQLAYATAQAGAAGCREVDAHPFREHFKVVFGYHTNRIKTPLGHVLECPSTGEPEEDVGGEGYCHTCRRCIGEF